MTGNEVFNLINNSYAIYMSYIYQL